MATSLMSMYLNGDEFAYQAYPQLERHNAVRRTKDGPTPRKLPRANKKDEAWIHELVRPPSLENLKPALVSQEWKVPDSSQHLTSISAHQSLPLIAVGSGSREKNLLVYEMVSTQNSSQLCHRQTVSLRNIHSLSWAPLGRFNSDTVLATGHRNGLVHLVTLPDGSNTNSARIIKKFNHSDPRRLSVGPLPRISHLEFTSSVWTCVPDASMFTLYGESVYLWDLSRSDRPLMTQRVGSCNGFHASPFRDGILSLSGAFGIALLDIRAKSRGLLRPKLANHSEATVVKWSPYNSNWVASAHEDSKLRIWDIRAAQPFAELTGHSDIINTVWFFLFLQTNLTMDF
ncbi:WD40-repeat-containing domain protein [Lipomyces arxii]|uniref:WD40-repeat-containing domain protein n=1 Tax=Lipomyces arxii TaxID=56418 RepID=UPI0034CF4D2D